MKKMVLAIFFFVFKITNRKDKKIPPIRDPKTGNIIATSDKEIANELLKHFTRRLTNSQTFIKSLMVLIEISLK